MWILKLDEIETAVFYLVEFPVIPLKNNMCSFLDVYTR